MLVFGVEISNVNYRDLLDKIRENISKNRKLLITYATAESLNKVYKNKELIEIFNKFDIVHPDGIGVYLASRFLLGNDGLKERITGSDFYPLLKDEICKNNWKVFFFGDTEETVSLLNKKNISNCIVGAEAGFDFSDEEIISKINLTKPDILIIGLGTPKQERWVITHKEKINAKIILCVGEGIKVFAGNKKRGPKILQNLGLEWIVRLFTEPGRLWKRYLLGIPIFIFRIIILKIQIMGKSLRNY